jgi:hypothetical protein
MQRTHPRLDHGAVREFVDTVVSRSPDESAVRGFLLQKNIDETGWKNKHLESAVAALVLDCGPLRNSELEPIEAKHSGAVYEAVSQFDDEALGDEDFWSYLAVRYFWHFISYRQEAAWRSAQGEAADPDAPDSEKAKLERYIIGKDHYQLPLRMYLRAQAVGDGDDFSLTGIEEGGTDFWRSQILGVRTSWYPSLARSVVRAQRESKLNVDEQRPSGRRINRQRANFDFILHTDDEAAAAIAGLWALTDDDREGIQEKKVRKRAGTGSGTKRRGTASDGEGLEPAEAPARPTRRAAAKRTSLE